MLKLLVDVSYRPIEQENPSMSSMQIILSIFAAAMFPTITAMLGIILNRQDARELRGEMSDVRERLARLEAKTV
jgi:hypothetical protein